MNYIKYIARQGANLCPGDCSIDIDIEMLQTVEKEVNDRFEYLASRVTILRRTGINTDPYHVMKHSIYLYLLSRALFENDILDEYRIKDRLYCLNKALHGLDIFYRVKLPTVFLLTYSTQIVLGACVYGENLVVYQGVTCGSTLDNIPVLGSNIVLMPNCVISGSSRIGNNVVVSAGVVIANKQVPDNVIVFGNGGDSRDLIYHPLKDNRYIDYFIQPSLELR